MPLVPSFQLFGLPVLHGKPGWRWIYMNSAVASVTALLAWLQATASPSPPSTWFQVCEVPMRALVPVSCSPVIALLSRCGVDMMVCASSATMPTFFELSKDLPPSSDTKMPPSVPNITCSLPRPFERSLPCGYQRARKGAWVYAVAGRRQPVRGQGPAGAAIRGLGGRQVAADVQRVALGVPGETTIIWLYQAWSPRMFMSADSSSDWWEPGP